MGRSVPDLRKVAVCLLLGSTALASCRANPPDLTFACQVDGQCPANMGCDPQNLVCSRSVARSLTSTSSVTDPSRSIPTLPAGAEAPAAGVTAVAQAGYAAPPPTAGDPTPVASADPNLAICAKCAAGASCVLNPGHMASCVCPTGQVGDGFTCTADLGCAQLNCPNTATCTMQAGKQVCRCKPGYDGDGQTCSDIDECKSAVDGCGPNATCLNTPGSHTCTCKPGFSDVHGDGSQCVDKCMSAACDANAACSIVNGDAACRCKPPFIGNGKTCQVDATCSTLNCDSHATCVVSGSTPSCRCIDGYTGNGTTCNDVNECVTGQPCDSHATCSNTPGSFSCLCKPGYSGTGVSCNDIDECSQGLPCDPNAVCTNTPGSFSCACRAGFDGNGQTCTQHNYCSPNPCVHGECSTSSAGYTCDCSQSDYNGINCESKIDDCSPNPCVNGGSCVDFTRAFGCSCGPGFSGKRCEIDVCNSFTCGSSEHCNRNISMCTSNCAPNCAIGAHCVHSDDCVSNCCGSEGGGTCCTP